MAEVLTDTIFEKEELGDIITNSKLGDLYKIMKYLQKRLNIIDSLGNKIEIFMPTSKEALLLERLCTIRHFLIHGQFQGIPSLGVSGSHVPLQECNTLNDIHNSFKIYLTFEPRLYFIKKYVESTIFPCVLSGHSGAWNNNNRDMKRIHFHIFESPSKKYKPLISLNDEPPIHIGNLAMRWDSFHNYRNELWDFCEFQNSIEGAKDAVKDFIDRKCKKFDNISPFIIQEREPHNDFDPNKWKEDWESIDGKEIDRRFKKMLNI